MENTMTVVNISFVAIFGPDKPLMELRVSCLSILKSVSKIPLLKAKEMVDKLEGYSSLC
jgi:hypothetical protein